MFAIEGCLIDCFIKEDKEVRKKKVNRKKGSGKKAKAEKWILTKIKRCKTGQKMILKGDFHKMYENSIIVIFIQMYTV